MSSIYSVCDACGCKWFRPEEMAADCPRCGELVLDGHPLNSPWENASMKTAIRLTPTEKALRAHGCEMDRNEFRRLLVQVLKQLYPKWTDEELITHPRDAIKFCDKIRARTTGNVPDDLILMALLNIRKNP